MFSNSYTPLLRQVKNETDKAYYSNTTKSTLKCLEELGLAKQFHAQGKTEIMILDLGCGKSPGLIALQQYFSENGIKISYHGVDINEDDINENETIFGDYDNVSFYAIDASGPEKLEGVFPRHFADLIFCQHPQVFGFEGKHVQNMLKETLPSYISRQGYVFISCYYEHELNLILNMQLNNHYLLPQEELLGECQIMRNVDPVLNTYVYSSKIPLQLDLLTQESKKEEKPDNNMRLSKCSMFKTVVNQCINTIVSESVNAISKMCCPKRQL